MKYHLCLALAALLLVSCGSKNHEESAMLASTSYNDYAPLEETASDDEPLNLEGAITRKIIKNGSIELEVRDLGVEKSRMDTLVKSMKGYYAEEQLSNTLQQTSYYLTIRLPADRFEQFIALIEKGGNEVTHKSIEAKDITEEYIDLETRLANKKNYMTRYQELLQSAKSVKDILEIQENIRLLEEEIESTTGRLKYLSQQVDYSTLNLTMHQPKEFSYSPQQRSDASEQLKHSLYGGWYEFVDFLFLLLYNWVLILFVLAGVTSWIIVRRRRRLRKS
ncbi:MAG: DUF4349 domain-containing protein [Bacteroidales bacterium]